PSYKDEDVKFRSDDLFVDAMADVRIDVTQHPDLQIAPGQRGKVGLVPEAVVVNEAGELQPLDGASNRGLRAALANYVKREREPFENIKNKEDKPMTGMEGGAFAGTPFGDSAMMMEAGAGAPPKSSRSRRKNPLRPGSSSGMMGAHMGP
ncbi:MAG: hypothetical protein B7Z55_11565, partial [Planctomycetales bacterium 12-60-4]